MPPALSSAWLLRTRLGRGRGRLTAPTTDVHDVVENGGDVGAREVGIVPILLFTLAVSYDQRKFHNASKGRK